MEKTIMIVRLHNLAARPPTLSDLKAVTTLMVACDLAESGIADPVEEDVRGSWQEPGFTLKTDAWVIVTSKGHIVGYAEVRRAGEHQLTSLLRVHPDYLGRGIGTLLVWLTEERSRQLLHSMPRDLRVTLTTVVSNLNQRAQRLFEREGYTPSRHFWRLMIQMEDVSEQSLDELYRHGKFKMDLVIDAQNLIGTTQLAARTGMYVARQYDVYEKELRAGVVLEIEREAQRVS
jgi:GNAT superfamily N-acetyltransferase